MGQYGHVSLPHPVCQWYLLPSAKELNLLSPDVFLGVKRVKKSLQRFHKPLAGLKGRVGKRRERETNVEGARQVRRGGGLNRVGGEGKGRQEMRRGGERRDVLRLQLLNPPVLSRIDTDTVSLCMCPSAHVVHCSNENWLRETQTLRARRSPP